MSPLIGITPSVSEDALPHGSFVRYVLSSRYAAAVAAAGGTPLILPPLAASVENDLAAVDAIILSGGGDLEPWRFGEHELHPTTYGLSPERDEFELALVQGVLARDLPLLAICRGIQVLNVALGGTLHQDVSLHGNESAERIQHRQHEAGLAADDIGHAVTLSSAWPLARPISADSDQLSVNSFHHQVIASLGTGLASLATAPDGVVEAVTLADRRFVLGLQWHPELMFQRHPEQLEPFRALVAAATQAPVASSRSNRR